MKKKFTLYIGIDEDGDWEICKRKMRWVGRVPGRDASFVRDIMDNFALCGDLAKDAFGAPPCVVGKQVKVTFSVAEVKEVKED